MREAGHQFQAGCVCLPGLHVRYQVLIPSDRLLACPCRADYPVRRIEDGQKRDVWLEMRDSSYCRRAEDEEEEAPVVQSMYGSFLRSLAAMLNPSQKSRQRLSFYEAVPSFKQLDG